MLEIFGMLFVGFWSLVFYLATFLISWAGPFLALAIALAFISSIVNDYTRARDAKLREIIREELSDR